MSIVLTSAILAVSIAVSLWARRHPTFGVWWFAAVAVLSVVLSAVYAAQRNWLNALWFAVCAAANVWNWWDCRRKKRRKRAPRAYGAKSRALIAAIVAKARAAAKPRPVLRPVPGGAQ